MNDLKVQLQNSLSIVRENKRLTEENAFLKAQLRLVTAKLAKERQWPINDLNARVKL